MNSTLLPPPQWAQLEFGAAELGDTRRTKRLIKVASALAKSPTGTLPQAFPDWAELRAAYRFFSNPDVDYQKIIAPHWQRTWLNLCEPGEFLLIEDTSHLDYSQHRHCQGLGQIGNNHGRGLHLHSTLALRVEAWDLEHCPEITIVGIAGQKCWARPVSQANKEKKNTKNKKEKKRKGQEENWRQRLGRERESERWGQCLEQMPPRPENTSWIYVADRESDIYEAFERCQKKQIDFIIRAHYNRRLAEEDQGAMEAVSKAPSLGCFELQLRERPQRQARRAKLEIRSIQVTLKGAWRPGGHRPAVTVNVVEAREINAPAGEEPIHWVLFTSLPAETFSQARQIVARYGKRWTIEEFHKALKTGANIEKSELETATRLQALLGVLSVVAVRLLNTKMLARTYPDHPVDPETFGPEVLRILSARFGEPAEGWKYGPLVIAIARMGGFLARRHDGDPGWITIWRGWQKLMQMSEGVVTLQTHESGVPNCG